MGEVWQARDTRLDRFVAIKQLLSPSNVTFTSEARAIAALNHPHICQIYDVGPDYLVLEYVEGQPLRGPLSMEVTVRLAQQVASALEAAHAKGILHRDLKPSNVLVTAEGTVKLLDFGVAKWVRPDPDATRTDSGMMVGTPAYMSPEQAQGQPIDARSEVFSFGAVLYELLAGRRAFDGTSTAAVLSAVLRDEPPALSVSGQISDVVRRCLQKDPAHRFPTMAAVRAALDDCTPAQPAIQRTTSIAVLPFANLSGDPRNEYFGDGLADELINLLVQIAGLKVIARTSAFAFKGKQAGIRHIAEVLDVTHVVEGSVRVVGNRVRVTVQLVSAHDGSHILAQRYDRELADVFAIQEEIAQAIARALSVLGDEFATRPRPTKSLPAYEALLRARHYLYANSDFTRSLASLEEAIALDPGFALAHSELGIHFLSRFTAQAMPAHEAVPLARRHAHTALELDPAQPEAHSVLGCIAALYDYDWAEADRRFRMAYAQGVPSHEVRGQRVLLFLVHAGRGHEAVRDMEHAVREDPLNWFMNQALAVAYRSVGRDDEADARYAQIANFENTGGAASATWAVILSGNYLARGQVHEALAFAETGHSRDPRLPAAIGQLAGLLARTGDRDRANTLLNQLLPGTSFGAPFGLALYYLALGELDQCADWLEKAIEQRDPYVSFLLNVGNFGGRVIWSTPRWPRLAQLMNVPPGRPLTGNAASYPV
jgi:serine/threonine-protein kinase